MKNCCPHYASCGRRILNTTGGREEGPAHLIIHRGHLWVSKLPPSLCKLPLHTPLVQQILQTVPQSPSVFQYPCQLLHSMVSGYPEITLWCPRKRASVHIEGITLWCTSNPALACTALHKPCFVDASGAWTHGRSNKVSTTK